MIKPASYKRWATCIVLPTGNPNFLDASCCNVDVVNGGAGDFLAGFLVKSEIEKSAFAQESKKISASFLESKFLGIVALNVLPSTLENCATTL